MAVHLVSRFCNFRKRNFFRRKFSALAPSLITHSLPTQTMGQCYDFTYISDIINSTMQALSSHTHTGSKHGSLPFHRPNATDQISGSGGYADKTPFFVPHLYLHHPIIKICCRYSPQKEACMIIIQNS